MRSTTAGAVRILLAVMISALLGACGSVVGPLPRGPADMEGVVTRISTDGLARPGLVAELMVEKDPSIPFEEWLRNPGPGSYEKVRWFVTRDTDIFRQLADGSRERATIEDLTPGTAVLAWHMGYFADSAPAQAGARMLVILDTP
jgi:hypothetical protein